MKIYKYGNMQTEYVIEMLNQTIHLSIYRPTDRPTDQPS